MEPGRHSRHSNAADASSSDSYKLLRRTGPMAVSSANISGQAPALDAIRAKQMLGAEAAVYLDGGPATIGTPSTIIDLSTNEPRVLREGAVSVDDIAKVLQKDPEQLRSRA